VRWAKNSSMLFSNAASEEKRPRWWIIRRTVICLQQCVAFPSFPGAYSGSEYAPVICSDCMSRFLAFSGNNESDIHASRKSLLLWAAWFLMNFLTVSFIGAV